MNTPPLPADNTPMNAMLSALRSVLIAIGAVLSAKGFLDSATVQIVVGAIMVIIPAVWGMVDKFKVERATKAREDAAVNAGIAASNAVPGPMPPVGPASAQAIITSASTHL